MSGIACMALRHLILSSDYEVGLTEKREALEELVRLELENAKHHNALHFGQFREHRANNSRVATIKEIRNVLGCGLLEAMIIVKGIESYDGIKENE